jgi:hypothetical protein
VYAFNDKLSLRKVDVYDEAADIAKYRNPENPIFTATSNFKITNTYGNSTRVAEGTIWAALASRPYVNDQGEYWKLDERKGNKWGTRQIEMPLSEVDKFMKRQNPSRRNPEESAVEVFEGFHGREPETILEYRFEEHEHEHLAGLGDLVNLVIITPFNKEVTINAPDPESGDLNQVVKLCCSEDRTQLYFVGGEQEMPVEALEKMGFKADANDLKDLMLLGVLIEVTYRTKKGFDNFKLVDYYHGLGEETGVNPVLLYDYRSGLMRVAGGQYVIEDCGIVN